MNEKFIEYAIINPNTGNVHQLVVNTSSDIIKVDNVFLGVTETFEAEAYHLEKYTKDNGLVLKTKEREFSKV